jgi:hypothetical protein
VGANVADPEELDPAGKACFVDLFVDATLLDVCVSLIVLVGLVDE